MLEAVLRIRECGIVPGLCTAPSPAAAPHLHDRAASLRKWCGPPCCEACLLRLAEARMQCLKSFIA